MICVTIRLNGKEERQLRKHLALRDKGLEVTPRERDYLFACHRKYGAYLIAGASTEFYIKDLEAKLAKSRSERA